MYKVFLECEKKVFEKSLI